MTKRRRRKPEQIVKLLQEGEAMLLEYPQKLVRGYASTSVGFCGYNAYCALF